VLHFESREWKRISVAIVLLILVRGICLLSVLPPFEGWDEHQHLAYVVFLQEQKQLPHYGISEVPRSMDRMFSQYPSSAGGKSVIAPGSGARTYDEFWSGQQPDVNAPSYPIPIYEAAQTPLYYLLALPVWICFSNVSYLAGIYALRLMNVLFLAGAVLVFLQMLPKCVANLQHRTLIALLVAVHPIYLINAARVANDALAILFASLTLYFTVTAIENKRLRSIALASSFLALGILTKAHVVMMLPVVMVGATISAYRSKTLIVNSFKSAAICGSLLALFLIPFYYYKFRATGRFFSMTQFLEGQLQGKSTLWIWSHFFSVGWSRYIREWIFTRDIWVSGWSYLAPPNWIWYPYKAFMYGFWFLVIGTGLKRGWGKRLPITKPEYVLKNNDYLIVFAGNVVFVVAGLMYFATLCLANWGFIIVIPSYFMIVLPVWTTLLYQCALFLGRRFAFWFAHILGGFYLLSELVGTIFVMPKAFTATNWSWETWSRLVSIHPSFPSPWFIVPCLVMMAVLLIYLLRAVWRSGATITAES